METRSISKSVEKFRNKSKWFSVIFKKYEYFSNLSNFLESLLSLEQQKLLELEYEGETIGFSEQLLICFEERFTSELNYIELLERVQKVFKQYSYIFNSTLESNQIRVFLLSEILSVTTVGPQFFYHKRNKLLFGRFKPGKLDSEDAISKVKQDLAQKFPNLPARIISKNHLFFVIDELFIGHVASKFESEEAKKIGIREFSKKAWGWIEKLDSCGEEYRDKYIEGLLQVSSEFIDSDINSPHTLVRLKQPFQKQTINNVLINSNTNPYLEELTNTILGCFEEEIPVRLSAMRCVAKVGKFSEQVKEKYYARYPSFAPIQDLKARIQKKCDLYRDLLSGENRKQVREMFLDELDQELFVSKSTHIGNQEMLENLKIENILLDEKINPLVEWAIEQILLGVGEENANKLIFKFGFKNYSLQTILQARGKRALLAQGQTGFKNKLLILFAQTQHHFYHGKNREINLVDLQAFLNLVDSCFLYPREGRMTKLLLNRDDTGSISKFRKNLQTLLSKH